MARGHLGAALALALTLTAGRAYGQAPPPPAHASSEEIQKQIEAAGGQDAVLKRIRESGLSHQEIRSRLAAMGYDPRILDAYIDPLAPTAPPPSQNVLAALRSLQLNGSALAGDSIPDESLTAMQPADSVRIDSLEWSKEEIEAGLRVFGREVFTRRGVRFEPVASGPAPSGYRIGPGDELVLVITGDVELAYTLPVTREGFVVIPQVGQVWVNGITLDRLREQLYVHLGRAYSGIRKGPEATSFFDVSLARLRSNQIYITGEVVRPGSYVVNPFASVLSALYMAGGPTGVGSFRDVRIMRGGKLVQRVDLYDYLLRGNDLSETRFEPGDVVFVPPHGDHVILRGEVKREAIYELRPGETLTDLIGFAGGFSAPAHLRRARITRILPPGQRSTPGIDRVVFDIELATALANPERAPALEPGDDVTVFAVRSEVRNVVSVDGGVWHEGSFGYHPGLSVWELIGLAGGLRPDAYLARANILRVNPADSTISVLPFSLETTPAGEPVEDPELREFDLVRIFSRSDFTESYPIRIDGEVATPLDTTFEEGMTLRDLILRAGGLKPTADLTVEVARVADAQARAEGRIVEVFRVPIDSSYFVSPQSGRYYLGERADERFRYSGATDFELRPHDRVFVRRIPNLEYPRAVTVDGEVRYPGKHVLTHRDERLRDLLLDRAGGLRERTAFVAGFRFFRNGEQVNIELAAVLRDADHRDNLILLPGDSMIVPLYNPVVTVRGAVNSPATVLYRKGADLEYYIVNAGGFRQDADRDRVHVRYANGSGRVTREFLTINFDPQPGPGSEVIVPARSPEEKFDWASTISTLAQIAGSVGTILTVIITSR